MPLSPLAASFYDRPVLDVCRDLLGARLVRVQADGQRLAGTIIETEAYRGEEDLACHARSGRTGRTAVMYGPPGRAYVYFIYGMHWMFNCVAENEGFPAAVLIRAILPSEGQEAMALRRRGVRPRDWANGPARLCQALGIDGQLNGARLDDPFGCLGIEPGPAVAESSVLRGPRVGIDRVPEPWRSIPWRMRLDLQSWNPSPDNKLV